MNKLFRNDLKGGRTGCLAKAALAVLVSAFAESSAAEQSGDFLYSVEDGGVTITGYTGPGGPLSIPEEIADHPVVAIGNAAFWNRGDLTGALVLPDSVAMIGASAFYECGSLDSLTLGSGVTEIGANAFAFCRNLSGSLVLPEGLSTINGYAFCQCNALSGELRIPDSVTSIGQSAFADCWNFTSLRLGSGIRVIGPSAFIGCAGLTGALVIPDNVKHIGNYAFCTCESLVSLNLGSGVTNIEYYAFGYCKNLSGTLIIPDAVESIGSAAFYKCPQLTAVTFGSGLRSLGEFAFADCGRLTGEVVLPIGVTAVERRTFYLCYELKGVKFGDDVTSIGEYAFFGCGEMEGAVVFPAGVTMIGDYAFDACPNIDGLYFKGDAPTVGVDVFDDGSSTVYYVDGRSGWGATLGDRPTEVWSCTVTFDAGVGSVTPGLEVYRVGLPYISLPTPVHAYNLFGGWWTEPNGGGTQATPYSAVPLLTAGYSLYALWLEQASDVTFDAQGGTAPYPAGKTVIAGEVYGALPRPARLGYAFGGWWTQEAGGGAQVASDTTVTETDDHTLYAAWTYDPAATQVAICGTALELPLPDTFATAARVTVKGLPTGLKYNAAAKTVSGVPTKAGQAHVTISAPGVETLSFTWTIEALPVWAQGLFSGYTLDGVASMSVSAQGKTTSGKLTYYGTSTTYTASSYLAGGNPATGFALSTVAKAGKLQLPLEILVTQAPAPAPESLGCAVAKMKGDGDLAFLWRSVWKEEPERLAPFIGYYTATLAGSPEFGSGYLTLTVDKAGNFKVGGKLADGTVFSQSGMLALTEEGAVAALIYSVPRTYQGGSLMGFVEFVKPLSGDAFLRGVESGRLSWSSKNPQATAVYGEGFVRWPYLAGGWYSKTNTLYAYYADYELWSDAASGAAAPEIAVGTNRYASIKWDPSAIKLTVVTNKQGVMTGLAAPKAGAPTDANGDHVWDYSAENTVGLKLGLTRATGLFKGTFKAWFDYPVNKHVSKTVSFEGTITPVREDPADGVAGRGFFLWPDKAVPPLPKKPYAFSWSYDWMILQAE